MSVIFLLIPLSFVIAVAFLAGFIWAVRSGQYEDTGTPPLRLLLEEITLPTRPPPPSFSRRSAETMGKDSADGPVNPLPEPPAIARSPTRRSAGPDSGNSPRAASVPFLTPSKPTKA